MALSHLSGQKRLKLVYSPDAQVGRLARFGMPKHKKLPLIEVSLFSAEAIVQVANSLPNRVQNPRRLHRWVAEFHGLFMTVRTNIYAASSQCASGFQEIFDVHVILQRHFYPAGFAVYISLDVKQTCSCPHLINSARTCWTSHQNGFRETAFGPHFTTFSPPKESLR